MTLTLCTMVWGNYWKRFGQQFVDCYHALNTKPDQVLIVSDRELDVPSDWDVVIIDPSIARHVVNLFRQRMYDYATCDWICTVDLDDPYYPNYLDDIQFDYDVHNILPDYVMDFDAHQDRSLWWGAEGQKFCDEYFDHDRCRHSPISPPAFLRRQFLIDNDIRVCKIGFDDLSVALQLILHGAKIYFDPIRKYQYDVFDTGVSNVHTNPDMTIKMQEMDKVYWEFQKQYRDRSYKASPPRW